MKFNPQVGAMLIFALFPLGASSQSSETMRHYQGGVKSAHSVVESNEVTCFNRKYVPDVSIQQEYRKRKNWQDFLASNGEWWVQFNEHTGLPQRAMGKPISLSGSTPEQKAMNFIQQQLADFDIPVNELVLQNTSSTRTHTFVRYKQVHNGIEVWNSEMVVKLSDDGRVIMFGANVIDEIPQLDDNIGATGAAAYATEGLVGTVQNVQFDQTKIVVVPNGRVSSVHLAHEFSVTGVSNTGTPFDYFVLVDAANGDVLYRSNRVSECGVECSSACGHAIENDGLFTKHDDFRSSAKDIEAKVKTESVEMEKAKLASVIEIDMEGTLYTTHSYNPATVEKLPNMNCIINGNTFLTDQNGYVSTTESGPQTATFELAGTWSTVDNNGTTPSFTATVNDGINVIDASGNALIQEISAFYHVNIIHDHMKTWLPSFTGMDFSLPTNVEVTSGTCNAFYNGSSINFYADGGGCLTYANVADVVYHEYGHGINDNFYQDNGSFFQNGAMNEGYADFWAMSYTFNPILGVGGNDTDPTAFIRRYDTLIKVYPDDIVGEVHADGEIICGAWWDTYINLGNDMNATLDLYADVFDGLQAATANGNEGTAFTNVLIDVLQSDDAVVNGGDNDITNGTPNGVAIVDAFDKHGITLISNAELVHTDVQSATPNAGIDIDADLQLNFPFTQYLNNVTVHYTLNNTGTWNTQTMTNTGGNSYQATISSQPVGTIVSYYITADDINNNVAATDPIGAARTVYPNLPYHIMVGFTSVGEDDGADLVQDFGVWTIGLPSDNNTTGDWLAAIPLGSYQTPGDPSTICQTDEDHTVAPGEICFVTGNASSTSDGLGTNDVDGGVTTLQSPTFDLTQNQNPTFTYWRWYTNSPASGANPNADWWQVSISDDNGATWVPIENNMIGEIGWRRHAFRVSDYVSLTNQVMLQFQASDSIRPGQNLDGGSLVEAALDDITLWDDEDFWSIEDLPSISEMSIFPNPAKDDVNLSFKLEEAEEVSYFIYSAGGRMVASVKLGQLPLGEYNYTIDTKGMAAGLYTVRIVAGDKGMTQKLKLIK